MAKTIGTSMEKPETQPTHEEIARRAYAIFEKSGRVQGRDMQNWLEAEAQLKAAQPQPQRAQPQAGVRVVVKPAPLQTTGSRM